MPTLGVAVIESKLCPKVNLLSLSVGQLEIQKWSFYEDFKSLQKEQDNLGKKLQDKYGDGNINLEEGTFTKAK